MLLDIAVREFFREANNQCLLLHTDIGTFLRQLYEGFGFHVIGTRGLMGRLVNPEGRDFQASLEAFQAKCFRRGDEPGRLEKLAWKHAPGLNLLFAVESGWRYRSHRYGIVGPG